MRTDQQARPWTAMPIDAAFEASWRTHSPVTAARTRGVTAMRRNVHVVKHLQGWAVVLEGYERPSFTTRTKCEAIAVGRGLAAHEQSELIIYDEDGRILQRDSYCKDTCPPES